jgi:hypothetical protein
MEGIGQGSYLQNIPVRTHLYLSYVSPTSLTANQMVYLKGENNKRRDEKIVTSTSLE